MKIAHLSFCILSVVVLCGYGCIAPKPPPDPLAGWHLCSTQEVKQLDKRITEDYEDYIHKIPPNERGYYLGPVFIYEDGTGRHAVRFETHENNKRWGHILIYDKDDKRIKTMKYYYGRFMS